MTTTTRPTLDSLVAEYRLWCKREGLELASADEVLAVDGFHLTELQRAYLERFLERWDAAQGELA